MTKAEVEDNACSKQNTRAGPDPTQRAQHRVVMAEFENQVQSQAQRRDHRGLQADAWITEFGAREKMKANEKAQD